MKADLTRVREMASAIGLKKCNQLKAVAAWRYMAYRQA